MDVLSGEGGIWEGGDACGKWNGLDFGGGGERVGKRENGNRVSEEEEEEEEEEDDDDNVDVEYGLG